jgi:hypothetical protein
MAYGLLAYGMLSGTFHVGIEFEENDWRSKRDRLGSLNLSARAFRARERKSGSLLTPCWRKPDSNFWSLNTRAQRC